MSLYTWLIHGLSTLFLLTVSFGAIRTLDDADWESRLWSRTTATSVLKTADLTRVQQFASTIAATRSDAVLEIPLSIFDSLEELNLICQNNTVQVERVASHMNRLAYTAQKALVTDPFSPSAAHSLLVALDDSADLLNDTIRLYLSIHVLLEHGHSYIIGYHEFVRYSYERSRKIFDHHRHDGWRCPVEVRRDQAEVDRLLYIKDKLVVMEANYGEERQGSMLIYDRLITLRTTLSRLRQDVSKILQPGSSEPLPHAVKELYRSVLQALREASGVAEGM